MDNRIINFTLNVLGFFTTGLIYKHILHSICYVCIYPLIGFTKSSVIQSIYKNILYFRFCLLCVCTVSDLCFLCVLFVVIFICLYRTSRCQKQNFQLVDLVFFIGIWWCMMLLLKRCLLVSAATVCLFVPHRAFASQLLLSVLFASLSAADSEADGDGKKRAALISKCLVWVLITLFWEQFWYYVLVKMSHNIWRVK